MIIFPRFNLVEGPLKTKLRALGRFVKPSQEQRLQGVTITTSDCINMVRRQSLPEYIQPRQSQKRVAYHSYWEGCGPGCVGYW